MSPGIWSTAIAFALAAADGDAGGVLACEEHNNRLVITSDDRPVMWYVFGDGRILRPYFAHVRAPSGVQVTRQHPPRQGVDATDHDTMHPGIWLAFGDLSGADFWRNKGRVEMLEFVERPRVDGGVLHFAASFRYVIDDRALAKEVARYSVRRVGDGWLLTFDSELGGERPIVLGDQEEMGLGIRLATPLAVKGGSGAIANSEGQRNEREVWGKTAAWCDYSSTIDGQRAGMVLLTHPGNFRPSWMHARDYGLLVANPFGRRAFTGGEVSRVEIKPGERLRLRYAVYAYATKDDRFDPTELFQTYAKIRRDEP